MLVEFIRGFVQAHVDRADGLLRMHSGQSPNGVLTSTTVNGQDWFVVKVHTSIGKFQLMQRNTERYPVHERIDTFCPTQSFSTDNPVHTCAEILKPTCWKTSCLPLSIICESVFVVRSIQVAESGGGPS